MSTGNQKPAAPLADREITTTRVFAAPRERVYRAFSNPDHLKLWWGPKGFTNTFREFDMRPGGRWRFVMHGPEGADYQNESVFTDVVRPERIVLQHVSAPRFQLTITLADQGGQTKLTWHMQFETAADCEKVKRVAVEANEENLDRLEAQLAKMV